MANSDILLPSTLRKMETQWGVSYLKIFCMIDIYKMAAILKCSIMANADIQFLLTLRKRETQTLGGSVI